MDQIQLQDGFQCNKNAMRQSELNVLYQAYRYFAKEKGVFDEYGSAINLVKYYGRGVRCRPLVFWGAINLAIGLLFIWALEYVKRWALKYVHRCL